MAVPGIYVAALGLALLLTREVKGSDFFRAVFYWPTMISSIVVGLSLIHILSGSALVEGLSGIKNQGAGRVIIIIFPVSYTHLSCK